MMKLMAMKQYMKMSKPALIRKITKALRVMPKKKLAVLCYNITKSKLPRYALPILQNRNLQVIASKPMKFDLAPPTGSAPRLLYSKRMRKTKRKFSRKQLAAQRLFAKRAREGTLRKRRRR